MIQPRIILGAILLAALVMVGGMWWHAKKVSQANAAIEAAGPKVVAPAHEIPPQVAQNMQTALAEREKKLQQLSNEQKSQH